MVSEVKCKKEELVESLSNKGIFSEFYLLDKQKFLQLRLGTKILLLLDCLGFPHLKEYLSPRN